jgi:hypothetical protein
MSKVFFALILFSQIGASDFFKKETIVPLAGLIGSGLVYTAIQYPNYLREKSVTITDKTKHLINDIGIGVTKRIQFLAFRPKKSAIIFGLRVCENLTVQSGLNLFMGVPYTIPSLLLMSACDAGIDFLVRANYDALVKAKTNGFDHPFGFPLEMIEKASTRWFDMNQGLYSDIKDIEFSPKGLGFLILNIISSRISYHIDQYLWKFHKNQNEGDMPFSERRERESRKGRLKKFAENHDVSFKICILLVKIVQACVIHFIALKLFQWWASSRSINIYY